MGKIFITYIFLFTTLLESLLIVVKAGATSSVYFTSYQKINQSDYEYLLATATLENPADLVFLRSLKADRRGNYKLPLSHYSYKIEHPPSPFFQSPKPINSPPKPSNSMSRFTKRPLLNTPEPEVSQNVPSEILNAVAAAASGANPEQQHSEDTDADVILDFMNSFNNDNKQESYSYPGPLEITDYSLIGLPSRKSRPGRRRLKLQ